MISWCVGTTLEVGSAHVAKTANGHTDATRTPQLQKLHDSTRRSTAISTCTVILRRECKQAAAKFRATQRFLVIVLVVLVLCQYVEDD
mmetsp:Transcript_13197/g.30856  ORF Transcript_13197/g.30856 Transcript_13197/m.30856 type:complete len:88 (+) Transcript_13197:394-657(+)